MTIKLGIAGAATARETGQRLAYISQMFPHGAARRHESNLMPTSVATPSRCQKSAGSARMHKVYLLLGAHCQPSGGGSGMIEVKVLGGDTLRICIRSTLLALDRDPKACANPGGYVSAVSDDVGRRVANRTGGVGEVRDGGRSGMIDKPQIRSDDMWL